MSVGITAFTKATVINDAIGTRKLVLIGDAGRRTVRAYERGERIFQAGNSPGELRGPKGVWAVTEAALVGPNGTKLARVAGHIAYWFAWENYLGANATLYEAN